MKKTLARMAMAAEHAALDYVDMKDRIADLESDNRSLRETLSACLEQLHHSQVQLARYQAAVLELRRADRLTAAPERAA